MDLVVGVLGGVLLGDIAGYLADHVAAGALGTADNGGVLGVGRYAVGGAGTDEGEAIGASDEGRLLVVLTGKEGG